MHTTLAVMSLAMALSAPGDREKSLAADASNGPILNNCLVTIIEELPLPGREAGAIAALDVKEGDTVKAGQVLGRIDDREAKAARKVKFSEYTGAKEQADNDVNVRYAIAATKVAKAEWEKAIDANKQAAKAIPVAELNRLELTYRKSELQIEQAKRDQTVAGITAGTKKAEVEAADLGIARRQLVSTIDGEVIAVYKHVGEWVPLGDPVFRVIRLDRLRVEGRLNVADYSPSEIIGRSVTVEVKLEHGRTERFPGKIVFVDPKVQAGGAYNIKAEVENREKSGHYVLRPGLPATMAINIK